MTKFFNGVYLSAVTIALSAVVICGCKTNKQRIDDYGKAMACGDYAAAYAEVAEKSEESGVDQLLWRLHAGGSLYLMNSHAETVRQFDGAEDIMAKNAAQGVFSQGSDTALAMMTNDRAFPYAGTGADRIFTCLYKAIDYAANGDKTAARTELNRAAQHQDNWLYERRKEIADAQKKLNEDADAYAKKEGNGNAGDVDSAKAGEAANKAVADAKFGSQIQAKCDFNPATDGNLETLSRKDYLNVYAEYVTGVFRWLEGEDDATVYLKEACELYPENVAFKKDYADMQSGVKPQNQVWVFVEDGLCPLREEWRLDLPLLLIPYAGKYVKYAGMALPYLKDREQGCSDYTIDIAGSKNNLVQVDDVDRILKTEFKVYFRGALVREITRTIVKVGVQVGLGIAAEHASSHTQYGLIAAQYGVAAYAASVTQADLRSWTGLPKRVYAIRVNRPADGKLILNGNGTSIAEVQIPQGNAMVFVRKPAFAAKPSVKVVSGFYATTCIN